MKVLIGSTICSKLKPCVYPNFRFVYPSVQFQITSLYHDRKTAWTLEECFFTPAETVPDRLCRCCRHAQTQVSNNTSLFSWCGVMTAVFTHTNCYLSSFGRSAEDATDKTWMYTVAFHLECSFHWNLMKLNTWKDANLFQQNKPQMTKLKQELQTEAHKHNISLNAAVEVHTAKLVMHENKTVRCG